MSLIALGANLSSGEGATPREACVRALEILAERDAPVIRQSRWYRSAPVPAADQPDFVNGVAQLDSSRAPADLLALLHEVEDTLGRIRGAANAARVIDLDLLACGDAVIGEAGQERRGLVLPHPRLHLRGFVLFPLLEIAPDWRHPATGAGIEAMIAALPPGQDCTLLD